MIIIRLSMKLMGGSNIDTGQNNKDKEYLKINLFVSISYCLTIIMLIPLNKLN